MKKLALSLLFAILSFGVFSQSQVIADHTIVADYDKIPDHYINEVKKMLVSFPGASHSLAYRKGLVLLEELNQTYQVNVAYEEAYTTTYLRCNDLERYLGEDEWFTWYAWPGDEQPEASRSIKDMIKRNYDNNRPITAIGFGWCWDMMSSYLSREYDPKYNVRWWGASNGSPDEGIHGWGLDAEDFSITQNRVSMDTYLNATLDYINYCTTNNYPTKVVFTTGPVDYYKGEQAYQTYIKHEYLRDFVKADPTRILFDYADILCYDDNGEKNTETWSRNDVTYTFPFITDTNLGDESIGHIGPAGALRLGKAIWWFLARIAGWDGNPKTTQLSDIESNPKEYLSYQKDDQLFIELQNPSLHHGFCSLFSIEGRLLEKTKITGSPIVINTNSYSTGMYIVTLSGQNAARFKVVIAVP